MVVYLHGFDFRAIAFCVVLYMLDAPPHLVSLLDHTSADQQAGIL